MTTFRMTVMATTMLAGFAIFAFDAAQAGPNGGPSLGNISGFSSMRMDFNRVGGPGRMLSRDDTRVVPLDVKKTEKAPKDSKNAAKKGTDVARVSNPKPASGGKGKEAVSASKLRIPAPLAELYDVTGGNLDDISQLAEIATWLKTGLPGLGSPLFDKGDGSFVPPTFGAPDRLPWGDAENGPGNNTPQRFENPNGKVSSDGEWVQWGPARTTTTFKGDVIYSRTVRTYRWVDSSGSLGSTDSGDTDMTDDVTTGSDGSSESTATFYGRDGTTVIPVKWGPITDADAPASDTSGSEKPSGNEDAQKEKPAKEKDSQPVAEGTGRPHGMHTVRCDIAGCLDLGMTDGRRVNPGHAEGSGAASGGGRALPSWATDPTEEGYAGGGGSGYGGYTPQDEGDGAPGGPGGPSM